MEYFGNLEKMESEQHSPVQYTLHLGSEQIPMNTLIGSEIRIDFQHQIHCQHCGRLTTKSYFSGYCWPCYKTLPQTDDCIFHPELCQAQEGISRDMEWSEKFCLQPHVVYLALSSDVKVGVTRESQIPTRWIDQGASEAIVLARTHNRHEAGLIEVFLKKHLPDKTNWRLMLQNKVKEGVDLLAEKKRVADLLVPTFESFISPDDTLYRFEYPVETYPEKIRSIKLDKQSQIRARLIGIKGQYLLFDDHTCLNVRNHGGYQVRVTA